jgi:hypothetical protein
VFLNENTQFDPLKPYYSVGAPNPNVIGGFTAYFQNWTGTNVVFQNASATQTGVVFQQAGATATARYKAHFGSSLSDAASTNSQRKLVGDTYVPPVVLTSLAYPSIGEIWVTQSSDGGESWDPEVQVSNTQATASFPSLAAFKGWVPTEIEREDDRPPSLFVVYRRFWNSQFHIDVREKLDQTWGSTMWLTSQTPISPGVDPHPVIGVSGRLNYPWLLCVWEGNTGLKWQWAEEGLWGVWYWDDEALVPGTKTLHRNPSISQGYSEESSWGPLYVTYDNGNDVLLRSYNYGWGSVESAPASIVPISSASCQRNIFHSVNRFQYCW